MDGRRVQQCICSQQPELPPPPPNLPILPSERFISFGGIWGELKNAVRGQTRGKVERPI